jgi:hypothetical protein
MFYEQRIEDVQFLNTGDGVRCLNTTGSWRFILERCDFENQYTGIHLFRTHARIRDCWGSPTGFYLIRSIDSNCHVFDFTSRGANNQKTHALIKSTEGNFFGGLIVDGIWDDTEGTAVVPREGGIVIERGSKRIQVIMDNLHFAKVAEGSYPAPFVSLRSLDPTNTSNVCRVFIGGLYSDSGVNTHLAGVHVDTGVGWSGGMRQPNFGATADPAKTLVSPSGVVPAITVSAF